MGNLYIYSYIYISSFCIIYQESKSISCNQNVLYMKFSYVGYAANYSSMWFDSANIQHNSDKTIACANSTRSICADMAHIGIKQ